MMTIHDVSGREQEACLIDLDTLPMGLATIDVSRVAEGIRPKLIRLQKECVPVLRDHFFGESPEAPILASLQAAVRLRESQLVLEKKSRLPTASPSRREKSVGPPSRSIRLPSVSLPGWLRFFRPETIWSGRATVALWIIRLPHREC